MFLLGDNKRAACLESCEQVLCSLALKKSVPGKSLMDPPSPSPEDSSWKARTLSVVMHELTMRLPNSTLEVLSRSQYWPTITSSTKDQDWWRQRIEFLVGRPLQSRRGNWAGVYRDIEKYGVQFAPNNNYYNNIIVQVLLELGADPGRNKELVSDVARCNNASALELLLADRRVYIDPYSNPIVRAAENGSVGCLILLLKDSRYHPGTSDENLPLLLSIENYQNEAVKLLLSDRRVDPSRLDNGPLKQAVRHGNIEIFELLVADKRVRDLEKDELGDSYFLEEAIVGGHEKIVTRILEIDDQAYGWYFLSEACKLGTLPIIKLLTAFTEKQKQKEVNMIEMRKRAL